MKVKDIVQGLSPSSVDLFKRDPVAWIRKYRDGVEPCWPRYPMDCGSAFDRLCKEGLGWRDPEASAGEKAADTCRRLYGPAVVAAAQGLFAGYTGLMDDLTSGDTLIMEDLLMGTVGGVPVRCRPDLIRVGAEVLVRDWKTAGWNNPTSPPPLYVWDTKTRGPHKDALPVNGAVRGGRFKHYLQCYTYHLIRGTTGRMSIHWATPGRYVKYMFEWEPDVAASVERDYREVWESDIDIFCVPKGSDRD